MTNHVHLLVTPERAATVPKLLISLGRRYVQYINRTYRRTGTLWDSRYKSSVVDTENYLLTCYRYIELNPVRAGVVADPAHYRWSSYRANGLGQHDSVVTPHERYLGLGSTQPAQNAAYRALFRGQLDRAVIADIRNAVEQSQPIGSSTFYAAIANAAGQRREPKPRGRPHKNRDGSGRTA